jgi:DNA-binding PadR family transcriptional regulator
MSVRHALLALLSQGPTYATRLRLDLQQRTGELWELNIGQVYTTLQRLERDGLVREDDQGRDTRYFVLTATGREELDRWLRTPPPLDTPPRDELVIKVLVAVDVPGVDVGDVVLAHRQQVVEAMQAFTRIKASADSDDVALAIMVDAELFRLEGVLRWLDAAEARLQARPPAPATTMAGDGAYDPEVVR